VNKECELISSDCIVKSCCSNICKDLLEYVKNKNFKNILEKNPIRGDVDKAYNNHVKQKYSCPICNTDKILYVHNENPKYRYSITIICKFCYHVYEFILNNKIYELSFHWDKHVYYKHFLEENNTMKKGSFKDVLDF